MEVMFRTAYKIFSLLGQIALAIMILIMIISGFIGSMVTIMLLVSQNGGDIDSIIMILKLTQFFWQLALVMFAMGLICFGIFRIMRRRRIKRELEQKEDMDWLKRYYEAEHKNKKSKRRRR